MIRGDATNSRPPNTRYAWPVVESDPAESSQKTALRGPGCLTVVSGGQVGLVYRVRDEKLTIGRSDTADVIVTSDGVSRHHAELQRSGTGSVKIVDLGSRNGTFVNRLQVTSAVLEDGDRIRIGEFSFDFRYERADDRATVDLAASSGAAKPRGGGANHVAERFYATMANLAKVHVAGGRYRDALATYERGRAALEAKPGADPEQLAATLMGAGDCHLELGEVDRAQPLLRRALDLLQAASAPERQLAPVRFHLARALGPGEDNALSLALLAHDSLDIARADDRQLLRRIDSWLAKQDHAES